MHFLAINKLLSIISGMSEKICDICSVFLKYNSGFEVFLSDWLIVDFWAIHRSASCDEKSSLFSNLILFEAIKGIWNSLE